MDESKPTEPAGRNPGWDVEPGPDDQGEAEFLREMIHAPDAPDLTGALAEHYRLQGEDGGTMVPTCTHGGDCLVPGHPNGPHGELREIGNLMQPGDWARMKLFDPCPAAIMLALGGGPTPCSEPRGHDEPRPDGTPGTNHRVTIEWRAL